MMILIVFIIVLGFYFLLNTSLKAELPNTKLRLLIQQKRALFKPIGISFLLLAFVMFMVMNGLAVGVLSYFMVLFTISSFLILFNPLKLKS